jgi:hypothetical protein
MRQLTILSAVVLFSILAFGQATVMSGAAGTWAPSYGYYAAPFVPLVVTPSISLNTFSPSPAGASNATAGLVAGASNSTLELPANTPTVTTEATWYNNTEGIGEAPAPAAAPAHHWTEEAVKGEHPHHAMELGIASFESSVGAAELAGSRPSTHAKRTYSNADVERMNEHNGMVRWDHKEEKL